MTPPGPGHGRGRRTAALALLLAALALAVLGQIYFFHRRDYLWDGLVWHGLAVLCFFLAWRMAASPPSGAPPAGRRSSLLDTVRARVSHGAARLRAYPAPAILMAVGMVLSAISVLLARGRTWDQPTHDVVSLWLLGVLAVGFAAFWPPATPRASLRAWKARLRGVSRAAWYEVATVAGLTALALLLRASALETVPYTLGGDEAWHGLLARQVLDGDLRNPFVMGYLSMPTFFYWPLSWSLRWLGNDAFGLRMLAALAGTATVPAFYLLVRRLWGRLTALIAAVLLATYEVHIHYSRLGANNVWDPLFAVLLFWLLERGLGQPRQGRESTGTGAGRRRNFILAGMVLGLSVYSYTGARLLPILAAAYLGFSWLRSRWDDPGASLPANLGEHLVFVVLAFLVVAGPLLGFALAHPEDWNARVNQVGILQSGWLAREPALTGKSTVRILAEQFLRSAGAFHALTDRTEWYGADRPLLGFLAGLLAVFGVAWAVAHWRERRFFLTLLWFWAVILTGGMLTQNPPSSQRLVMAILPAILLVTVGMEQSVKLVGRLVTEESGFWRPRASRVGEGVVLGMLVLVLALIGIDFYFLRYTPSRAYGGQNGETATMIGHYLQGLPAGTRAHFFGAPHIYWTFGTMAFLAPQVTGEDVVAPLAAAPGAVENGGPQVFIFLPERAGELAYVRQTYPGGLLRPGLDRWGNDRYIAYEVR